MDLDRRTLGWAVFGGYLLLVVAAIATGDSRLALAVDVAFILVVLGFAAFAYREHSTETLGPIAAALLAGAAAAEAVALLTQNAAATGVSNVLLIAGLLLYFYLRRGA